MSIVRRKKPIGVVEARRLYEQTNLPIDHIAAMHGIGRTALYRRIHLWGWHMRRPTIPLADPPRQPDEIAGADESGANTVASDIAAIAVRIRRAVERELDVVERTVGTVGAPERSRMLASLARTLQEVARLDVRPNAPTPKDADDRGPDDPDDFIRDLVRRMDAFAAGSQGSVCVDASTALPRPARETLD